MLTPIRQRAHRSYQFLRLMGRSYLWLLTLSIFTLNLTAQSDRNIPPLEKEPDVRPLPVGAAIVRKIAPGEVHIYKVELRRGQALLVKATNIRIDAGLFIGEYSTMRIVARSLAGVGSSPGNLVYVAEQNEELAVSVGQDRPHPPGTMFYTHK